MSEIISNCQRLTNGCSNKGDLNKIANDGYTYETLESIANYLLERTNHRPKLGIICGSGLGGLANLIKNANSFNYETIPNFPISTVVGHSGKLIFGELEGVSVVCLQGRFHYYEGYSLSKCCMPVRVMKLLGITHFIATNAAGGLNDNYKVGDIMVIKDHINMLGLAGNNPLTGPNDSRFGDRFPAMNTAYDTRLNEISQNVAEEMGISNEVHTGVYGCLGGPSYETIAELRLLKMLGVDAVGMSTVHEVITAKHCDLTVFCFSLITNKCVTDYNTKEEPNHAEVIGTANEKQEIIQEFVRRIIVEMQTLM